MRTKSDTVTLDRTDKLLINRLQKGFPVSPRPYLEIGEALGIGEQGVIERLRRLLDEGALTRLGAILNAPQLGGERTLAAVAAPAERLEAVIAAINRHPQVSHNYERTHRYNLWFVISSEDAGDIERVIHEIEAETGLPVINLPTLEEYRVEFYYELPVD
ncbi:MAG: AsnC family transcriptional regulator [Dehalococcoidia bacterium]|nr:AsnC family transcriptional regulator [Dehalococcoidia bacterium]